MNRSFKTGETSIDPVEIWAEWQQIKAEEGSYKIINWFSKDLLHRPFITITAILPVLDEILDTTLYSTSSLDNLSIAIDSFQWGLRQTRTKTSPRLTREQREIRKHQWTLAYHLNDYLVDIFFARHDVVFGSGYKPEKYRTGYDIHSITYDALIRAKKALKYARQKLLRYYPNLKEMPDDWIKEIV